MRVTCFVQAQHDTLATMKKLRLILASGSPRRRDLLEQAGYSFEVIVSKAEECAPARTAPETIAEHNALLKAHAVAEEIKEPAIVIGADTVVSIEGTIFGKPHDKREAKAMLEQLSGKTHQVITGVCLMSEGVAESFHVTTDVMFKVLTAEEIETYIASGEPMDKAGAYGIQGKGGELVDHIHGDYDNVVGLPVSALASRLKADYGITSA